MDPMRNGSDDFVTVVSVGNQPQTENFVTVLSIGTGKNDGSNGVVEGNLEEEVEVYRLPGERLGFGLKFEGGNKTSERVRRLFVQSCAEQSPASRTKCSWGSLGEGDEILSIDGVPVTLMSRLECVRRLKESQLVIKLLVRCRGALKPEVVSAERKPVPERSKIPPELPAAPPPVPPRKLRQARGSADGEANPSPARKIVSPVAQACLRGGSQKSTPYDSCNSSPKSVNSFAIDSPKKSANERSPEFTRIKSEPPEAMVYLDARSQDGSSTHGSTSDDTGSSMSTVVDRISTSDRFSTTSTVSITSELVAEFSRERVESQLEMEKFKESSRDYLESFEQLDRDFSTNPPDYLLKRLTNSQAVTHVESRGEAGALVEKVTAVVAPNTVVIEETMTLQPPLSFQDAPLSYGHEARPGIFYTADLAADSTTHFRPIRDDVSLVESINGDVEVLESEALACNTSDLNLNSTINAPPLPARNHVNCISVNQNSGKNLTVNEAKLVDNSGQSLPTLPPKPLPRKDAKLKRKRLPPPPPPPTTLPRDLPPPVPARNLEIPKQACENTQEDNIQTATAVNGQSNENILLDPVVDKKEEIIEAPARVIENERVEHVNGMTNDAPISVEYSDLKLDNTTACSNNELLTCSSGINKVLEIIEMKKVKAHNDSLKKKNTNSAEISQEISQGITICDVLTKDGDFERLPVDITPAPRTNKSLAAAAVAAGDVNAGILKNSEHKIDSEHCDTWTDARECLDEANNSTEEIVTDARAKNHDEIHQSEDLAVSKLTDNICDSANDSDSSSASDENDYYWQNNLATIGEEEEITLLEYTNENKEEKESAGEEEEENVRPIEVTELQTLDAKLRNTSTEKDERDGPEATSVRNTSTEPPSADKADKDLVNGRMDNCGGGQRLPPDGDEFPAAYHEFSSTSQQYQLVELPMSEKDESYECTSKHPIEETRISSQYIVTSVTEMTISPEVIVKKAAVALPRERRHSSTYSSSKINSDSSVVMTEKKIEIAGYYPKESQSEIDSSVKDSTPPPLPLTGPPRIEKPVPLGRTVSIDSTTRKFTSNLRRQDDKSEKSVRDKIAMFSSQSNLQTPLFPANPVLTTSRRLSKYKSNEDFFADDKTTQRDRTAMFAGRTSSSCDLTDSHYGRPPPSLPQTLPPDEEDVLQSENRLLKEVMAEEHEEEPDCLPANFSSRYSNTTDKIPSIYPPKSPRCLQKQEAVDDDSKSSILLTRATSFSGDISSSCDSTPTNHGHISRANSLASTFRRHSEDMRRTSLNQLIEQRKKSISKLRGLVIPEKVAVPVAQPITDLPEIKSRDSILVNQMPKASIPDKWGSQSSLASNTSTQSVPVKTTTFKIPAPQILPKYSPAFKRKSLTVCGSGSTSSSSNSSLTPPTNSRTSPVSTGAPNDAPKSLESICSPTRSDYSFEYISSSLSPENMRNGRSKPTGNPRKTRPDYDDSDNDSAVSSQSSISRGFSPSTSPVPSERSNLSSERSYSMSLLMEIPSRNYSGNEQSQFSSKSVYPAERTYRGESNRSCDSTGSNSRSPPLPEHNPRFSAIPQRQALKRSSSTETNYSTSSSTLTSGSQASAESLSRRVLKPQSVEAINRKNILASARCRSGQNLNGSPLIQRKFSDDEQQTPIAENLKLLSAQTINGNNGEYANGNIKIAYIEVIDNFICPTTEKSNHLPAIPAAKSSESSVIQPSNDLKMWVQSEAKSLLIRENSVASENDSSCFSKASGRSIEICASGCAASNKSVNDFTNKDQLAATEIADDDVIATLTTRSRSRAPINFEDVGGALDSSSQMSLEDILSGKAEPLCLEAQSATYARIHEAPHGKSSVKSHLHEPLTKEKTFVSKIPTYGRLKSADNVMDEITGTIERSKNSKIPMQRALGRRSASVTDVKKAVEKTDYPAAANNCHPGISTMHQRYSSLDSSVEPCRPVCVSESDRCYTDFGSVSSFASSTSLISPQELAQLLEEASLEDLKGIHDVVVVVLHKENPNGSVGITLAGGVDCETKEITVHRVLAHSIADRDGRVQRGDRILSINGRSTRGLTHRESLAILKQPRAEVVLVVSRAKAEDGNRIKSRTDSVETIVEGFEVNGSDDTAWGPLIRVTIIKDGAGLGFSLEGGRDSPLGDKSLVVKKIFTGGAAEKTGALTAGDQLLEVNGADVTRMSRIEVWSLMKKLNDGEVNLLVRRPATKSS